jgi:hypothetical protein
MPDVENSFPDLLRTQWPGPPSEKARRYLGKFYACERIANRITGKVEGKHGYCHHCAALAYMFFQSPAIFQEVISKNKTVYRAWTKSRII